MKNTERLERKEIFSSTDSTLKLILTLLLFQASLLPVSGLNIEDDVICPCECYRLLSNCDCAVAEEMREKIKKMADAGLSKEKIISNLQNIYGREILATPPKEGIFTGLWIYPAIVLSAGAIVVGFLLKRKNARWYGDPDETIDGEYPTDEYLDEVISGR
jgi:cytochrome c-type biogenesis protein CcmH